MCGSPFKPVSQFSRAGVMRTSPGNVGDVGRDAPRRIQVDHWRDRAAEMRVLSSTTKDIEAQAAMVRLADVYDKLADRAELRANGEVPREAGRPWAGLTSVIAVTCHGEVLGNETQVRRHPYLPLTRSPNTPKAT
jgi:hypothetical protein